METGVAHLELGIAAELNARVAGLDFDRDGRDEIVVASARGVAVLERDADAGFRVIARAPSRGGATAVTTGDFDGDGRDEVAVGWGAHRDHLESPAVLSVYRIRATGGALEEEIVAIPETSRAQFSTLQPARIGGEIGLLYAHFASKYDVRAAFARRTGGDSGTWSERELAVIRMAALWLAVPLPGGRDAFFVGRPYGDEPKSDGGVFLLEPDGRRSALPSLRGVRSLARLEFGPVQTPLVAVCYGDGWHWRYRELGEGRLTCAQRGEDGAWVAELVDDTESYEINTLATGDLDADGIIELIALGSDALHAYTPARDESGQLMFTRRRLWPGGFQMAVVDSDGDGRSEVVLAGERPVLVWPVSLAPGSGESVPATGRAQAPPPST